VRFQEQEPAKLAMTERDWIIERMVHVLQVLKKIQQKRQYDFELSLFSHDPWKKANESFPPLHFFFTPTPSRYQSQLGTHTPLRVFRPLHATRIVARFSLQDTHQISSL